jgi:hypothetical protein
MLLCLFLPLKLFHIPANCLAFYFTFILDIIFLSSIGKRVHLFNDTILCLTYDLL